MTHLNIHLSRRKTRGIHMDITQEFYLNNSDQSYYEQNSELAHKRTKQCIALDT